MPNRILKATIQIDTGNTVSSLEEESKDFISGKSKNSSPQSKQTREFRKNLQRLAALFKQGYCKDEGSNIGKWADYQSSWWADVKLIVTDAAWYEILESFFRLTVDQRDSWDSGILTMNAIDGDLNTLHFVNVEMPEAFEPLLSFHNDAIELQKFLPKRSREKLSWNKRNRKSTPAIKKQPKVLQPYPKLKLSQKEQACQRLKKLKTDLKNLKEIFLDPKIQALKNQSQNKADNQGSKIEDLEAIYENNLNSQAKLIDEILALPDEEEKFDGEKTKNALTVFLDSDKGHFLCHLAKKLKAFKRNCDRAVSKSVENFFEIVPLYFLEDKDKSIHYFSSLSRKINNGVAVSDKAATEVGKFCLDRTLNMLYEAPEQKQRKLIISPPIPDEFFTLEEIINLLHEKCEYYDTAFPFSELELSGKLIADLNKTKILSFLQKNPNIKLTIVLQAEDASPANIVSFLDAVINRMKGGHGIGQIIIQSHQKLGEDIDIKQRFIRDFYSYQKQCKYQRVMEEKKAQWAGEDNQLNTGVSLVKDKVRVFEEKKQDQDEDEEKSDNDDESVDSIEEYKISEETRKYRQFLSQSSDAATEQVLEQQQNLERQQQREQVRQQQLQSQVFMSKNKEDVFQGVDLPRGICGSDWVVAEDLYENTKQLSKKLLAFGIELTDDEWEELKELWWPNCFITHTNNSITPILAKVRVDKMSLEAFAVFVKNKHLFSNGLELQYLPAGFACSKNENCCTVFWDPLYIYIKNAEDPLTKRLDYNAFTPPTVDFSHDVDEYIGKFWPGFKDFDSNSKEVDIDAYKQYCLKMSRIFQESEEKNQNQTQERRLLDHIAKLTEAQWNCVNLLAQKDKNVVFKLIKVASEYGPESLGHLLKALEEFNQQDGNLHAHFIKYFLHSNFDYASLLSPNCLRALHQLSNLTDSQKKWWMKLVEEHDKVIKKKSRGSAFCHLEEFVSGFTYFFNEMTRCVYPGRFPEDDSEALLKPDEWVELPDYDQFSFYDGSSFIGGHFKEIFRAILATMKAAAYPEEQLKILPELCWDLRAVYHVQRRGILCHVMPEMKIDGKKSPITGTITGDTIWSSAPHRLDYFDAYHGDYDELIELELKGEMPIGQGVVDLDSNAFFNAMLQYTYNNPNEKKDKDKYIMSHMGLSLLDVEDLALSKPVFYRLAFKTNCLIGPIDLYKNIEKTIAGSDMNFLWQGWLLRIIPQYIQGKDTVEAIDNYGIDVLPTVENIIKTLIGISTLCLKKNMCPSKTPLQYNRWNNDLFNKQKKIETPEEYWNHANLIGCIYQLVKGCDDDYGLNIGKLDILLKQALKELQGIIDQSKKKPILLDDKALFTDKFKALTFGENYYHLDKAMIPLFSMLELKKRAGSKEKPYFAKSIKDLEACLKFAMQEASQNYSEKIKTAFKIDCYFYEEPENDTALAYDLLSNKWSNAVPVINDIVSIFPLILYKANGQEIPQKQYKEEFSKLFEVLLLFRIDYPALMDIVLQQLRYIAIKDLNQLPTYEQYFELFKELRDIAKKESCVSAKEKIDQTIKKHLKNVLFRTTKLKNYNEFHNQTKLLNDALEKQHLNFEQFKQLMEPEADQKVDEKDKKEEAKIDEDASHGIIDLYIKGEIHALILRYKLDDKIRLFAASSLSKKPDERPTDRWSRLMKAEVGALDCLKQLLRKISFSEQKVVITHFLSNAIEGDEKQEHPYFSMSHLIECINVWDKQFASPNPYTIDLFNAIYLTPPDKNSLACDIVKAWSSVSIAPEYYESYCTLLFALQKIGITTKDWKEEKAFLENVTALAHIIAEPVAMCRDVEKKSEETDDSSDSEEKEEVPVGLGKGKPVHDDLSIAWFFFTTFIPKATNKEAFDRACKALKAFQALNCQLEMKQRLLVAFSQYPELLYSGLKEGSNTVYNLSCEQDLNLFLKALEQALMQKDLPKSKQLEELAKHISQKADAVRQLIRFSAESSLQEKLLLLSNNQLDAQSQHLLNPYKADRNPEDEVDVKRIEGVTKGIKNLTSGKPLEEERRNQLVTNISTVCKKLPAYEKLSPEKLVQCFNSKKNSPLEALMALKEVIFRATGIDLNVTQLSAIWLSSQGDGNISCELDTGEGKSAGLILGYLFMRVLQGKAISQLTLTHHLAEKCYQRVKKVADYLGIDIALIDLNTSPEEYKKAKIRISSYSDFALLHGKSDSNGQSLCDRDSKGRLISKFSKEEVIIDEWDKIDRDIKEKFLIAIPCNNSDYDPKKNRYESFYPIVINFIQEKKLVDLSFGTAKKYIPALRKYLSEKLQEQGFGPLTDFPREQLQEWLVSGTQVAQAEEGVDYTIEIKEQTVHGKERLRCVVKLLDSEQHTTESKYGRDGDQLLCAKLNSERKEDVPPFICNLSTKSVFRNCLKQQIKSYDRIVGVTATLGERRDCERLKTEYNMTCYKFERHRPNVRKDHPPRFFVGENETEDKQLQLDALEETLKQEVVNRQRPTLYITKNLSEAKKTYDDIEERITKNPNSSAFAFWKNRFLLESKGDVKAQSEEIKKMEQDNTSGIAGQNYTRGLDITPENDQGLVLFVLCLLSFRANRQAIGRPARYGKQGDSYLGFIKWSDVEELAKKVHYDLPERKAIIDDRATYNDKYLNTIVENLLAKHSVWLSLRLYIEERCDSVCNELLLGSSNCLDQLKKEYPDLLKNLKIQEAQTRFMEEMQEVCKNLPFEQLEVPEVKDYEALHYSQLVSFISEDFFKEFYNRCLKSWEKYLDELEKISSIIDRPKLPAFDRLTIKKAFFEDPLRNQAVSSDESENEDKGTDNPQNKESDINIEIEQPLVAAVAHKKDLKSSRVFKVIMFVAIALLVIVFVAVSIYLFLPGLFASLVSYAALSVVLGVLTHLSFGMGLVVLAVTVVLVFAICLFAVSFWGGENETVLTEVESEKRSLDAQDLNQEGELINEFIEDNDNPYQQTQQSSVGQCIV